MENRNKQEQQISIELPEEIAEGEYCNFAIIAHSHEEFVIDFVRYTPGVPKAKVKSRVILSPAHAKRLVAALSENVKKFESEFGSIADAQFPGSVMPFGFGPAGQA
jgi:hypothetical protein